MNTSLFRRRPRLDPDDVDDIARALRELWRRVLPRRRDPDPIPVPPPPITSEEDPVPQEEADPQPQRDPQPEECVGDCDDDDDNCPTAQFCFNNARYVGTPREGVYDAQLRVQEAQMNSMSPGQIIYNRGQFEALGRPALERLPNVRQRRSQIVAAWQRNNPGRTLQGEGLAVLHRLDMVAGGNPTGYYAVGDTGINSSIGRSWAHKKDRLDQHARTLQANGCTLMRVRLYSSAACPAEDR